MSHIPLDRSFAALSKTEAARFELGSWGRRYGGWLSWDEVLRYPRAVLLAEASSGKTEELRAQAEKVFDDGGPGFFVRIEDLADGPLETALDNEKAERFARWRDTGNSPGFFFLDSVDEARLNRKSFESALRRFANDVGPALDRARVIISCRASDWRGQADLTSISKLLPPPTVLDETPAPDQEGDEELSLDDILGDDGESATTDADETDDDPEAALLGPIFDTPKETKKRRTPKPPNNQFQGLRVFQLTPLTAEQRRKLASATGTPEVDRFLQEIERLGLDAMAERPGDLLDLASYWRDHRSFGSLRTMTEASIERKLGELDPYRPDNDALSPTEVRDGAERIAAAMTFGRSFTLLATGAEPDPTLTSDALDPKALFPEWSDAKRGALVRRGIFAPSTYGRLRFHHREVQEYLAASWLNRILSKGSNRARVFELLFGERYGVETVIPSLRPIAAWLAIDHADICGEIIRREPMTLLAHGDPKSLTIETRAKMLKAWAAADDGSGASLRALDDRAYWLFSDRRLAPTIRKVWAGNPKPGFRSDLLAFIREAAIVECADLALEAACDGAAPEGVWTGGLRALEACGDSKRLQLLADKILADPAPLSAQGAATFARVLFPKYWTVAGLLTVIAGSQDVRPHTVEGIGYVAERLVGSVSGKVRHELVVGLAKASIAPPGPRLPAHRSRYSGVAAAIAPWALEAVRALGAKAEPDQDLLLVLRAVARGYDEEKLSGELLEAIRSRPRLNRALLWSDVAADRAAGKKPRVLWQVGFAFQVPRLWGGFQIDDLSWLAVDMRERADPLDKELALNGIVTVLRDAGEFEARAAWLDEQVAPFPNLVQDLAQYRAPPKKDQELARYEEQHREDERKAAKDTAVAKESWRKFREQLATQPDLISDGERVASWSGGAFRLWSVCEWLRARSGEDLNGAVHHWRELGGVWGEPVAEAFHDGLLRLWRFTKPARPVYSSPHNLTTNKQNMMALAAIGLEAAEVKDWPAALSATEVSLAAMHGAISEQGYPEWLGRLVETRPEEVLPVVITAIRQEWKRPWGRGDVLDHLSRSNVDPHPDLKGEVLRLWKAREPKALEKLRNAIRMVMRADLGAAGKRKAAKTALSRFHDHVAEGRLAEARINLALAFTLDSLAATGALEGWLRGANDPALAADTISDLFARDRALVPLGIWSELSLPVVERLVRLTFEQVPPSTDPSMYGARTVTTRDDARDARDGALGALSRRSGPQVFQLLSRLAEDPLLKSRQRVLRQYARERAEADTERPAWSMVDVVRFEREQTAPARTGADLMRIIHGELADIQLGFTTLDASTREHLARSADERQVQDWLIYELNQRARGRYHVFREAEVDDNKKPDLIAASTSSEAQVAIEVKHGGKGWSARQLKNALINQLANLYLLPPNRRHGLLVVTHHPPRTWRCPVTKAVWNFQKLGAWLTDLAKNVVSNRSGDVEVRYFGLDTSR